MVTVPTVSRCFRSDATNRSGFTTWELSREGSLELAVKLVFIQWESKYQLAVTPISKPARTPVNMMKPKSCSGVRRSIKSPADFSDTLAEGLSDGPLVVLTV
jgi:hypothetical protein